ncbi:MAG: nicotinate-nucleotide adenylyltransferase [Clostridia bacterium]|nr:nicotinate-nucleotide adenylyltransferase [Clostridia bacterium]
MKVGILGGTFDPVHNGHIEIALAAMAELGLDQVALMPSGDPPHKTKATDRQDRLHMARLAVESHPGLYVSDREISRAGTTYTVDTLSTLTVEHPEVEWTYILGADALYKLDTWREFPRIARLCSFAGVSRPDCDEDMARLRAGAISACYHTRVCLLPVRGPALSSTAVRRKVAQGEDIRDCVPEKVAAYIAEKGLYLCRYSESQLLQRLKEMLNPHRYQHTLGVADTAFSLAASCGVEPARARLAGLLHDCAKSMPLEQMRDLVQRGCPDMDSEELETRSVLHAPAGMIMARDVYGVMDPSILSAIRKHTLGDGTMSPMDALIYVSDFIEPGREAFPGLERARKLAKKDIYRAMVCCAGLTAKHLEDCGQTVHPRTMKLLENYGQNR